jgi:hypothetical protein
VILTRISMESEERLFGWKPLQQSQNINLPGEVRPPLHRWEGFRDSTLLEDEFCVAIVDGHFVLAIEVPA